MSRRRRGDGAAAACVLRDASRDAAGPTALGRSVAAATTALGADPHDGARAEYRARDDGARGDGAFASCVPAMIGFDAARRTLTNCLKGCTITALTSDMVAVGRCRCQV